MHPHHYNPPSLKLIMNQLRDQSSNIQFEAFHVFKIFVAYPNKPKDISNILFRNRVKLIAYLESFHSDSEDLQARVGCISLPSTPFSLSPSTSPSLVKTLMLFPAFFYPNIQLMNACTHSHTLTLTHTHNMHVNIHAHNNFTIHIQFHDEKRLLIETLQNLEEIEGTGDQESTPTSLP